MKGRKRDDIPLSKKYGLNPTIAICPMCGERSDEILLLGASYMRTCNSCKIRFVSYIGDTTCPKCGSKDSQRDKEEVDGSIATIVGRSPCKKCKERLDTVEAEIERGGVVVRCKNCESRFVAPHDSALAISFRKEHPDKESGCMVEKCPVCEKGHYLVRTYSNLEPLEEVIGKFDSLEEAQKEALRINRENFPSEDLPEETLPVAEQLKAMGLEVLPI
jgi:uncharacterized Zn finger protein (UPF0148 family)